MARVLDEQKKRLREQQLQGRTTQVQKPGAVQTQSPGQQTAQTQSAGQTQQAAEQHTTSGSGNQTATTTTTTPATQSQDNGVVAQAQQVLNEQLGSYSSRYGSQINDLVAQLQNRGAFEYDINADPTYQMLREIWSRDGMMAMEDTMGQAAQLTGGYGNSYAQTAGQQTYQGYMRSLNEMVPDLKEAARADYDAETDSLLQQYSLLMEQEEQDYNRYLNALEQQRYDQEWQYQQSRDEIEDARYDQEWAYQQEQDEKDYALNLALAAYEMGDDSLVRALGINPQDYGVSYGSSGSSSSGGGGNETLKIEDDETLEIDEGSLAKLEAYYGELTAAQIETLIEKGEIYEYEKDGKIYYTINQEGWRSTGGQGLGKETFSMW